MLVIRSSQTCCEDYSAVIRIDEQRDRVFSKLDFHQVYLTKQDTQSSLQVFSEIMVHTRREWRVV